MEFCVSYSCSIIAKNNYEKCQKLMNFKLLLWVPGWSSFHCESPFGLVSRVYILPMCPVCSQCTYYSFVQYPHCTYYSFLQCTTVYILPIFPVYPQWTYYSFVQCIHSTHTTHVYNVSTVHILPICPMYPQCTYYLFV